MCDIQPGKLYAKTTHNGQPDKGITPRYVISTKGFTVEFYAVKPDDPNYEILGSSKCSDDTFDTWADIELPINDVVKAQLRYYENQNQKRQFEAASEQIWISALEARGYKVTKDS